MNLKILNLNKLLLINLILVNIILPFRLIADDEQQEAARFFKKQIENAHPTPLENLPQEKYLLPMDYEPLNSNFQNVNTITNENEQNEMQNESSIAINPLNPLNIIASAVDYRAASSTWVYVSNDGGKTWTDYNLGKPYTNWTSTNDPSITFDNEGNGYFVYGGFGTSYDTLGLMIAENGVFLSKTNDGGKTWQKHIPVIIHLGKQTLDSTFEDKYYITCDNSSSSPYYKNLYIPWKRVTARDSATQIIISRSTDRGLTWKTPIPVSLRKAGSSEDTTYGQSFPLATTGPNGEVYVVWNDGIVHGVGFAKSTDGGVTFSSPKIIFNYNIFGKTINIPGFGWRHSVKGKVRAETYPVIACDIFSTKHKGRLYLTWAGDSIPNIYFSYSDNGGSTWSSPKIVHSVTTNDHFWQWLAIDPTDGDLAVMYLDSRRDPNNILCETWVSYSSDGGSNWTDRCISDDRSDLRLNPFSGNGFAGDYSGLSFYGGKILPSWVDMRNAVKNIFNSDVFTGLIKVDGLIPPQNFKSSIIADSPTSLKLNWDIPNEKAFGQPLDTSQFKYQLFRNDTLVGQLFSSWNSFNDINLTPYTENKYSIRCVNQSDTSIFAITKAFSGGSKTPAVPYIVSANGNTNNSVTLNVQIPSYRSDSITSLVNLSKVRIYRDDSIKVDFTVSSTDTGKIVPVIDNPGERGYYKYKVSILDNNTPPNESSQSNEVLLYTGSMDVQYFDNFDSPKLARYLFNSTWGLAKNFSKSSPNSLTESPSGNYIGNMVYLFTFFPYLSIGSKPYLQFWTAAIIDPTDTAHIEVSYDNGKNFNELDKLNKSVYSPWADSVLNQSDWKHLSYQLDDNTGDTVIVRFRFKTSLVRNDDGWYIDDFSIGYPLSIKESDNSNQNNFVIYPNPSSGFVYLDLNDMNSSNLTYSIYDIYGNKAEINESRIIRNSVELNLNSLPNGFYFIKIINADGSFKFGKILIEK